MYLLLSRVAYNVWPSSVDSSKDVTDAGIYANCCATAATMPLVDMLEVIVS